jgi:hypothetical protein
MKTASIINAAMMAVLKLLCCCGVTVIVMLVDPCVGVMPGIMYLYTVLLVWRITMAGGTTKAIIRNTAATEKTSFLCIITKNNILIQSNKR